MFVDDLKMALGFPQIRVELQQNAAGTPDDFTLIMQRTLRVITEYFPCQYIIRKEVPSGTSGFGEGVIDLSGENFMSVKNVYLCKSKSGTKDVLLPWSAVRIWEMVWLGKSDFMATDLLLYQNELRLLNQATNALFNWKYDDTEQLLYITNAPTWSTGIGIVGLRAVQDLDDLDDARIVYEYALRYAVALGKQKLGHLWRKYNVQGVEMPGSEVVAEGKQEEQDTMREIEANAYYPGGIA